MPEHPIVPTRVHRSWRRPIDIAASWVVAGGAVLVGTIVVGWPATPLLAGAQAALPLAGPLVLGASLWSLGAGRPHVSASGAVVTAAVALLVVPTFVARPVPPWAAAAPRLRIYSANLRFSNATVGDALARARDADADVVVFNEYVPAFDDELLRSGLLDDYPTVVVDRVGDGNLLLTRLPVRSSGLRSAAGIQLPSATVRVGDTDVLVAAVHTQSPSSTRYVGPWARQVAGVARAVDGADDVIAVGDYNSSVWNPPLRRLLGWGFVDAQDATGGGPTRTWGPDTPWGNPAVLGIDHALSRGDRVVPLSVEQGAVPGSDHRSLTVTYAVRG